MWRLANSLITLRDQVNSVCPGRNKASDGTIGDAAHAASVSDHNPNGAGVVTAIDITHDPAHGFDIADFSEMLRINQDARIKYVIANRRIFIAPNYNWINYIGSDPHTNHVHISVSVNSNLYDNGNLWKITTEEIMDRQNVIDMYGNLLGRGPDDGAFNAYVGASWHDVMYAVVGSPEFVNRMNDFQYWRNRGIALQEEITIHDTDNEYGRWNKLGVQIRGRELSRDEFRAAAVGKTWLQAMEILSDNPEADLATEAQNKGSQAQLDAAKATKDAAVTAAQKTAPVATKAPWYIRLLAALAGKK